VWPATWDAGTLQQGDEAYLLLHVSALKPRKASFLDDLNEYQANNNLPIERAAGPRCQVRQPGPPRAEFMLTPAPCVAAPPRCLPADPGRTAVARRLDGG
jgi:hypothetical protein